MSVFYDPKQKKVKIWLFVLLAFVPFVVLGLGWMATQKKVELRQKEKVQQSDEKIWDSF